MSTGSDRDAAQALLRSAFDTLADDIAILDAHGTVTTAKGVGDDDGNGRLDASDLTSLEYLEAGWGIDDAYATRTADGLTALLNGERDRFDLEYPDRASDEQRWILLRATPFTHRGERYVVVARTDITERKQREKALRDTYEICTDDRSPLSDRIADLLQIACETIGTEYATLSRITADRYVFEVVAATIDAEIEAGDTAPLAALPNCERVVETQKTLAIRDVEAEAPALADSEWGIASYLGSPVTVDGELYGTFCFYSTEARTEAFSEWEVTFVDLLSKWVSYELERREHVEKLQQLKSNASDVIWMSSPEKDEIEFISDSYADVWGRPPETLTRNPTSFVNAIHPDDRNRVEQALENQQEHPDEYEETYRVVHPDGTVRWVHDRSSGVYADGNIHRIIGIATDITSRKEREQELAYQTALLDAQAETTIDGLLVVDSDRSIRYHNDRFLELWEIPKEMIADRSDEALLEFISDSLEHPRAFRENFEYLYNHPKGQSRDTIELADGRWLDRYSAPVIGKDGTHYGRLWTFRDITAQKERERTLERQRDELVQLERVNTLVRQSVRALQDATTRREIETAVCEALTQSDLYRAAWIADWTETEAGDWTIRPQTAAGVDESYLEGIPIAGNSPAETALRTNRVQVINDIATAPEFPDERREIALARGHEALAAIPLSKAGTTYGVLVVYAPPNYSIVGKEREILADLGRSIALAIQRVHSQRSLTANTVVSLTLRIPDSTFVFALASVEFDAEIALERRIRTDEATLYYLSVDGADPTPVCERLLQDPLIEACTVVREGDDTQPALVEAHLAADTLLPLDVLTDYGATVSSARATDGDISLQVELPLQADIRTVLTAVRKVAPTVELINKQQIERPTETDATLRDRIMAQLTDKQNAALETAYTRGYYAWPRESTMEEIAESFDLSAPTMHYHLRKAHEIIIESLLDPR